VRIKRCRAPDMIRFQASPLYPLTLVLRLNVTGQ
jgi:hypothetical protein